MQKFLDLNANSSALKLALDGINKQLADLQKQATGVGKNLEKGIKDSGSNLGNAFNSANQGVTNLVRTLSQAAPLLVSFGGMRMGALAMKDGFAQLGEGVKNSLVRQASGMVMAGVGLQSVTNGLIDVQNGSKFMRQGTGLGMNETQIQTIGKMAASLGVVSDRFDSVTSMQRVMEAITDGSADKLKELSTSLYGVVAADVQRAKATTVAGRQQVVMNSLLKNFNLVMDETGDVADTSMGKLLGWMNKLQSEGKGALQMFGGLAKMLTGLASPIAALGGAGMMFGGPLGGGIGALIGLGLSSALAGLTVKLGDKMTSGDDASKRMEAMKILIEQAVAGGATMAFTGKAKAVVQNDILMSAFPGMDLKGAQGQFRQMFGNFTEGGRQFHMFGDMFNKGFKATLGNIEIPGMKELRGPSEKLGFALGSIAGSLSRLTIALLPSLIDALPRLTTALDALSRGAIEMFGSPDSKKNTRQQNFSEFFGESFNRLDPKTKAKMAEKLDIETDLNYMLTNSQMVQEMRAKGMNPVKTNELEHQVSEAYKTRSLDDDRELRQHLLQMVSTLNKAVIHLGDISNHTSKSANRR